MAATSTARSAAGGCVARQHGVLLELLGRETGEWSIGLGVVMSSPLRSCGATRATRRRGSGLAVHDVAAASSRSSRARSPVCEAAPNAAEQAPVLSRADASAAFTAEASARADELAGVRLGELEHAPRSAGRGSRIPRAARRRLARWLTASPAARAAASSSSSLCSDDRSRGSRRDVDRARAASAPLESLVTCARGLGDVDREPHGRRGEERGGHRGSSRRSVPCQRIHASCTTSSASAAPPEHPVGDAEQPRAHDLERRAVGLGDAPA